MTAATHPNSLLQRPIIQLLLVSIVAAILIITLDAMSETLDLTRFYWDWVEYIDMAEHGVAGNPELVAPFAFRPVPSLLAGAFSDLTGRSVQAGFRLLAYGGLWAELVLAYVLARQFTRRFWGAFAIMLIVGASTFNVRFYLHDPYRPDPLAFPLLLLGVIGLVRRHQNRRWDVLIVMTAILGAGIREFTLIPICILCVRLIFNLVRKATVGGFIELLLVILVIVLAIRLPRELILVSRTGQYVDVIEGGLFGVITDWVRDLNIFLAALLLLLPVLVVLTRDRLRRMWAILAPLHVEVVVYALLVLALTTVGGSDLARFSAYGIGLVIIALAVLVEDGLHPWEIVYALAATSLFHRPWVPVAMENVDTYQDWIFPFYDRFNIHSILRMGEWALWVLGGFGLRWAMRRS